jgi:hypothetical protein
LETRTLITARNPRWGSPDHFYIELECKFEELAAIGFVPFTAALADPTPHGAAIFALARQGRFGPVSEFQQTDSSHNDGVAL